MFESVRKWLTVGIALAALLGFVYFFGSLVFSVLFSAKPPAFTPEQINLATIVSGLVGGVVAAGFGQKLPEDNGNRTRVSTKVSALGDFVQGGFDWTSEKFLGSIYAAVYVVLGLFAIYVAYFRADVAPDLLKSLANITLGLFIAIATAFFGPTQ